MQFGAIAGYNLAVRATVIAGVRYLDRWLF